MEHNVRIVDFTIFYADSQKWKRIFHVKMITTIGYWTPRKENRTKIHHIWMSYCSIFTWGSWYVDRGVFHWEYRPLYDILLIAYCSIYAFEHQMKLRERDKKAPYRKCTFGICVLCHYYRSSRMSCIFFFHRIYVLILFYIEKFVNIVLCISPTKTFIRL